MIEVEICASTIRDVAIAMEAGAGRVELCSVWSVGGITPNVVVVEAAASMGMSVRALIRPREGSFVHSPSERSWAAEEAKVMLDCGAERVVVGGLDSNGGLDEAYLETLVEAVGAESLVWHRAIDASESPEQDIDTLLDWGVTSILSSGGAIRAVDGLARIESVVAKGMKVVAGGGGSPRKTFLNWLRLALKRCMPRAAFQLRVQFHRCLTPPFTRWTTTRFVIWWKPSKRPILLCHDAILVDNDGCFHELSWLSLR